jgi:glyoxylase-like metal-dependent hydrolase (beta-lactamase superfamily II)
MLIEARADAPVETHLDAIVTTHAHWDHIRALAHMVEAHPGVAVAAGRPDAAAIEAGSGVVVDRPLDHGDQVGPDSLKLDVIALRGHTPGSVALAWASEGAPPALFTGDSLFPGGVGNTGGDAARFESLFADVSARLFDAYPDATVVYPGHGESTTLGDERDDLPLWRDRGW